MDELSSTLLKSRVPTKSLPLDKKGQVADVQCPLRKGVIYYRRKSSLFERNIHSSCKHEPRIVANLPTTSGRTIFQIVPIKRNRMLVMGTGSKSRWSYDNDRYFLHLSIHDIHSDRVGPALWTYHDLGHPNIFQLQPMTSTTNPLGITFGVNSESHIELFDVSTDAEKDYPLTEAGRLNYDGPDRQQGDTVILSSDRCILLYARDRAKKTIAFFYSGSTDANDMDFSFVAHVSAPNLTNTNHQEQRLKLPKPPSTPKLMSPLTFSADGSKFAFATTDGVVSVWDIRSKVPFKEFTVEVLSSTHVYHPVSFLRFSSGILGKEVLVFVENESFGLKIIHLIDATSFETEEILCLPTNVDDDFYKEGETVLFFDPSGGSMYAAHECMLYEWDMRKNNDPEWWLGEE